jgi:hypothetical protein
MSALREKVPGEGHLAGFNSIDSVVPVVPSGKRITNYVQTGIRSVSIQAPFTPGLFITGHSSNLVSAKTTALTPLVLQNESTFGLNVKGLARFKKEKMCLQEQ